MAGGPSSYPREIRDLSFYHDNFPNSDAAANHVISHNRGPGTFLLRPSFRTPGVLTLTISINDSNARHVNVQFRKDGRSHSGFSFFIISERSFSTFHDLYCYYSMHTICNLEMVSNVRLLMPIERVLGSPPPPPPAAAATAAAEGAFPVHGPMVTSDEIPPIPRKQSVTSWTGSVDAVPPIPEEGGRLGSMSQPGFPEIPPIPVPYWPGRPSLDSQGNDNAAFSSSSGSGSEMAGAARGGGGGGRAMERVSFNGQDLQPPQYLAPSPGARKSDSSIVYAGPSSPASSSLQTIQSVPVAAPTVSAPATLSKKELKELKELKKLDKKCKEKMDKKDRKKLEKMTTRAPMPIPIPLGAAGRGGGDEGEGDRQMVVDDEPPYYSTPKPHKNKIDDLKKMLRESEMCDCGLRMMDAELAQGWTVHRSRDTGTFMRVFYQHDDGNTSWHFPPEIADRISDAQVVFVVRLCLNGAHEVPDSLNRRYQALMASSSGVGPGSGGGAAAAQPSSSFNSSRSRSSSSGSSDHLGSNLSLSRSPPYDPRSLPDPGNP